MQGEGISTERLQLSALTMEDVTPIVDLLNDFEVARMLARVPYPFQRSDAEFFLTDVVPNEPTWRIADKSSGCFMGVVGLAPSDNSEVMEIGYWLGQQYWRKGYATEAASAVVAYAFNTLQLKAIKSGFFDVNPASGRVLEKLGFLKVGISTRFNRAMKTQLPHVDLILEKQHALQRQIT